MKLLLGVNQRRLFVVEMIGGYNIVYFTLDIAPSAKRPRQAMLKAAKKGAVSVTEKGDGLDEVDDEEDDEDDEDYEGESDDYANGFMDGVSKSHNNSNVSVCAHGKMP